MVRDAAARIITLEGGATLTIAPGAVSKTVRISLSMGFIKYNQVLPEAQAYQVLSALESTLQDMGRAQA